MKAHALLYAEWGWRVFPVHTPIKGGGCSCRNPKCENVGKHPRTRNGLKDATTDPQVIEGWWCKWPGANIGIATGKGSGIVVIDIDRKEGIDGEEAIGDRQLPDTVEQTTGSGGRHLIYIRPKTDKKYRTYTNILKPTPGVDSRADGGYIVAPPSLHESWRRYEWEASSDPTEGVLPVDPPEWFIELIEEKPHLHSVEDLPEPSGEFPLNIKEMLEAIPADNYDTWIGVGMALHRIDSRNGFRLWDEWSAKSDKYKGTSEIVEKWTSFKRNGNGSPPVDIGTVRRLAEEHGWVDPARGHGAEVAEALKSGTAEDWPDPQQLKIEHPAIEYPIDALPARVKEAVIEVQQFVKAPVPMVASSAISALSLAAQAHVDVRRASKLDGPTSLFMLVIADSGERKSSCDKYFLDPIKNWEKQKEEQAKPLLSDYRAEQAAWEAEYSGVKDKIKRLAKEGKSTEKERERLKELDHNRPEEHRTPRLVYEDFTPEGLKWDLATKWPSAGIMSSEAGIVLGSHGMGKDSIMRSLATLNKLWDGTAMPISRRTSECFIVRGARVSAYLQIQKSVLERFFEQSGGLARGTGFMARFLISWPRSTQGTRFFTDPNEDWPALDSFKDRIAEILDAPTLMDKNWELTPNMLDLSPGAKDAWVEFHDEIESELKAGGQLEDIKDVASKIAENAARMAALFHVFDGVGGPISAHSFDSASRITLWHLGESLRFFNEVAPPEGRENAEKIEDWLLSYCEQHRTTRAPTKLIQQYAPGKLREKAKLDAAIDELAALNRVRRVQEGRKKFIEVNPKLLGRVVYSS
ncbi:DUF3987 domain-containing protein [Nitrosococcus wardiae]|uniref:DUF3987 domain-containing protein n=1 Tax=Nitrosococcus wardiae TaxID=1814290 RepID=UPI00141BEC53|nr:DUF3987 domain-containing protein [Nitrosococcus wardiae]